MTLNTDRPLLASVLRWARTNGITRARLRWADCTWEFTDQARNFEVRLEVVDDGFELFVALVSRQLYSGWPTSVVQAVDVLAALGVLPVEKSSAHMTGWQAAMDDVTDLTIQNRVDDLIDTAYEEIEAGAVVEKHLERHCPQVLPAHPFDRRVLLGHLGRAIGEIVGEAVDHRGR